MRSEKIITIDKRLLEIENYIEQDKADRHGGNLIVSHFSDGTIKKKWYPFEPMVINLREER